MNKEKAQPISFCIQIQDTDETLKEMRKVAEEGYNDETNKYLIFSDDEIKYYNHSEIFFQSDEISIYTSFGTQGPNGDNYVSINIPLTDDLLMQILEHTLKRFNKFRTAVEALK